MLKHSLPGIYSLTRPEKLSVPVIFDSPHSGRIYPPDFHFDCDLDMLRRAEDNEVDLLFADAPLTGGALLCAEFPRTYIDVNRRADDIDLELVTGAVPPGARPGQRSHAGIGLIRRVVRPGVPLYRAPLDYADVAHRIERYYRPYHDALDALVAEAHYNFGQVWHLNCHSMPSSAASASGGFPHQDDFVLGDRNGTSCAIDFTHAVCDFLRARGYRVTVNAPYKGVELVRRHGRPRHGFHSLQIEISKSLYWIEYKGKRGRDFDRIKTEMTGLADFCADYARQHQRPLAAD